MRHFIARLIQCKFDLPQAFHACSLAIGHQLERRLECQRRDRSQHFRRYRGIDALPVEAANE
jgi:hypothetical protein